MLLSSGNFLQVCFNARSELPKTPECASTMDVPTGVPVFSPIAQAAESHKPFPQGVPGDWTLVPICMNQNKI